MKESPSTMSMAVEHVPVVEQFRQILLWPLELIPIRADEQIQRHWRLLRSPQPGGPWREVEDEFTGDPKLFQERHYSEFVTFLPYVQRFLYGEGDGTAAGDRVWTYGNSSLRAGLSPLSPHTGISLGDDAADGGWSHPLYTVSPGIPGDSGSGFMTQSGQAIGVLSTLGLAPLPASNNIGDLAQELTFAQAHSGIAGLQLVHGTEPFDPIL